MVVIRQLPRADARNHLLTSTKIMRSIATTKTFLTWYHYHDCLIDSVTDRENKVLFQQNTQMKGLKSHFNSCFLFILRDKQYNLGILIVIIICNFLIGPSMASDVPSDLELEKLYTYDKETLVKWLVDRGDSMKGLHSLKDYRHRYMLYSWQQQ